MTDVSTAGVFRTGTPSRTRPAPRSVAGVVDSATDLEVQADRAANSVAAPPSGDILTDATDISGGPQVITTPPEPGVAEPVPPSLAAELRSSFLLFAMTALVVGATLLLWTLLRGL